MDFTFYNLLYITFLISWVTGVITIAILGAIIIWYSAVIRSGITIGGTIGLIPAAVFFFTGVFIWPIYATIVWFNRKKLTKYISETLLGRVTSQ